MNSVSVFVFGYFCRNGAGFGNRVLMLAFCGAMVYHDGIINL